MNIFILLSLFSSLTLLFLGNWVYSLDKKKPLNRIFLILCLSLSYWAFTEFMLRQADTPDTAYFWMKMSILWPFTLSLFVHLALVFSEEKKLLANKLTYLLIYGPAVFFSIVDLATNLISDGLAKEFWGYTYVSSVDSLVFWVAQAWIFAMGFSAFILCARYGFKSNDRKKKQQAKYMSLGFSFPLWAGLLTGFVAPSVLNFKIPDFTITSTVGLGVLVGYAIWKYDLFSLNPATAAENIISIMPDSLIITDKDGKTLTVNQSLVNLSGYKESELVGNSANMLFVEDRFWSEIQEKLLNVGVLKDYQATLQTKRGEQRNVGFSGVLVKSKKGQIFGIVGIAHDVTDRKKAEELLDRTMNELVLVNEKLGVVGSLTRHDVRNKLFAVTGNTFLLKKNHADQADIIEGLSKIEQAVKDSVKIFEFAKAYEQLGIEELSYVDVAKAVDEAAGLFPSLNLKVINDCQGLIVLADSFLRQLFYNLIDNTMKYGKKTTTIQVFYEKIEDGGVRLIYEDDGEGISEENKLKLFSEGFSTGGSTGFGLFLIKKMIEVYGWTIKETGEPGKGAQFTITIPKLSKDRKENIQVA
jgi:PAS domain S-box-containing protein